MSQPAVVHTAAGLSGRRNLELKKPFNLVQAISAEVLLGLCWQKLVTMSYLQT